MLGWPYARFSSLACRGGLPLLLEGCAADNEIGRAQSMNAALNRIRLSLDGKATAKPGRR